MKPIHGKYLGETLVISLVGTPYEGFTARDWAMVYIERYGGFDGDHHKAWVLDQVARILNDTPVEVREARWEDGFVEYRIETAKEPSQKYQDWVRLMLGKQDGNGDYEYDYDVGTPP